LPAACTNVAVGATPAKQHHHHYKHEVIATAAIAIVAMFLGAVIATRLLYNLYYLYLAGTLMARPRLFTLGGAAGAASEDPSTPGESTKRRIRLAFGWETHEALRLPVWGCCIAFLVLFALILAACSAAFAAISRSLVTLAPCLATRFSSAIFFLYKAAAALSSLVFAF
jgi:hypothetical protein